MSAFIVGEDHINLLVTAAKTWRVLDSHYANLAPGKPDDSSDVNQVGRALLRENTRSVLYRYDGEDLDGMKEIERYKFRSVGIFYNMIQPVHIMKAAACYDYQACETHDYRERWAARWIQQLKDEAGTRLPGYDESPTWEYRQEVVAARGIG